MVPGGGRWRLCGVGVGRQCGEGVGGGVGGGGAVDQSAVHEIEAGKVVGSNGGAVRGVWSVGPMP